MKNNLLILPTFSQSRLTTVTIARKPTLISEEKMKSNEICFSVVL